MKGNMKEIIRPTLILFVICLVITALLAGTNLLTKDKIAQQALNTAAAARQTVLPGATEFTEKTANVNGVGITYYEGMAGGKMLGYVFATGSKKGYGGEVKIMTGVTAQGDVGGVALLTINETPGLGMNAQKPAFRAQYQQAAPEGGFTVIKSGEPKDGEIEAMTGATITTKAITEAVNEALTQYQAVKGGA